MSDRRLASDLVAILARVYRVPDTDPVWRWAESHVYLDNQQAVGRAGYYDSAKTPWNRRMQECDSDPSVSEVIVAKSSRSGVTEAAFNIIRRAPLQDPGHLLYMLQNRAKVRSTVKRRIIPTLRRVCPGLFTGDPDDVGLSTISLMNMELHFWGSGSESPFTEIAYKRIFLDEFDDLEQGDEETTADLARSRQRDVPGSKLYLFGKCKRKRGHLWNEYVGGTQEKFLQPCPRCNAYFEMHEGGFRWQHLADLAGGFNVDDLIGGTRYQCPACKHEIAEGHKAAMVAASQWHPTPRHEAERPPHLFFQNPEREGQDIYPYPFPGRVSLRVTDFYALHEKLSWGHLAQLLIEGELNPHRLRHFIINHTGRGYDEAEASIEENEITRCIGGKADPNDPAIIHGIRYSRGEIPVDPVMVAVTGDVQEYGIKFVVTAWELDGTCWVIDWGSVTRWREFEEQLLRGYPLQSEPTRFIRQTFGAGLIDSRFREDEVFTFVLQNRYRIFPSKGVGGNHSIALVAPTAKRFLKVGKKVQVYHYNDKRAKDILYKEKIKQRQTPRLYLPHDIDADFIAELTAEKFVTGKDKFGATVQHWIKVGPENDLGDCLKKSFLVWHLMKDKLALAAAKKAADKENTEPIPASLKP